MGKILFYNVPGQSKTGSLRHTLENIALKDTGITLEEVTQDTLMEKLTDDVDLFILPGAKAGTAYRDELKGKKFDHIRKHIDRGMHILGICAGSFVLSKSFTYDTYDKKTGNLIEQKNIQSEMGLVDVHAWGPDMQLYEDNTLYTAADITFDTIEGKKISTALVLAEGPCFTGYNTKTCTPIATYNQTGDIAMIAFRHGNGGGILSGPAFDVGSMNVQSYPHSLSIRFKNRNHLKKVTAKLKASRDSWAMLWVKTMETLLPGQSAIHQQIRKNFGITFESNPSVSKKLEPKTP